MIMNSSNENVVPITSGSGSDSTGGGGNYGERLARVETKLEHMATKEDIQKIKVWILGGILGSVVLAMSVFFTILKFFSSS